MNPLYADRRMEVKHFEKITNYRDIGGLPTQDGRVMKRGILFPLRVTVEVNRARLGEASCPQS